MVASRMSKPKSGIYGIFNRTNGKMYIGSTNNLNKRFNSHKSQLGNNKHYCIELQNDFNKGDIIEYVIIEEVDVNALITKELEYFEKYNPVLNGYNTSKPSMKTKGVRLNCGIYCIYNKTNEKRYIGKSVNVSSRISKHLSMLSYNNHYASELQYDYNSGHNISIAVLEKCSEDDLDRLEKYYIDKFNAILYGYNSFDYTTNGELIRSNKLNKMVKYRCKITNEDVKLLRISYIDGTSIAELSRRFNISYDQARSIAKNWQRVDPDYKPIMGRLKPISPAPRSYYKKRLTLRS